MSGGIGYAFEHQLMCCYEAQKPVYGQRRGSRAKFGCDRIGQAAQLVGESAGLVPFDNALCPLQCGQPSDDQLGNRFGAGFPSQPSLELSSEPRVVFGLVQYQLRELVCTEIF